ncbi:hypothetical protein [Enterovibrio norvegicus]|uniref:hypothetical protein n=1 Tax=Enterovibrio norvegicus TaxID=188144 RepID=UPI00352DE76F
MTYQLTLNGSPLRFTLMPVLLTMNDFQSNCPEGGFESYCDALERALAVQKHLDKCIGVNAKICSVSPIREPNVSSVRPGQTEGQRKHAELRRMLAEDIDKFNSIIRSLGCKERAELVLNFLQHELGIDDVVTDSALDNAREDLLNAQREHSTHNNPTTLDEVKVRTWSFMQAEKLYLTA